MPNISSYCNKVSVFINQHTNEGFLRTRSFTSSALIVVRLACLRKGYHDKEDPIIFPTLEIMTERTWKKVPSQIHNLVLFATPSLL